MRTARRRFACIGRFESCLAEWREPDRYRELRDIDIDRSHSIQGAGLSLAGASFGPHRQTTGMRRFNRILGFDSERLILHAEAGITLGELFDFLAPRGICIPVQPGFPGLTLGGCIAANVHGKNQYREGTFCDAVQKIELFHPRHGTMWLSPHENASLFELTCGGLGLTGIIVSAMVQLKPLQSNWVSIRHLPVSSLAETAAQMTALRDSCDLLYSWNDLGFAGCRRSGSGFIVAGRHVEDARPLRPARTANSLRADRPVPHFNALTAWPLWIANRGYKLINTRIRTTRTIDARAMFFPFPAWQQYIDAYGRGGMIEHQVLIPTAALDSYFAEFAKLRHRSEIPIGLATMKAFRGECRMLWFRGDGMSLAIHVPASPEALAFLDRLDAIDLAHRAIAYIIKDARLPGAVVRKQYPDFEMVRQRLAAYDPERRFGSMLADRIGL